MNLTLEKVAEHVGGRLIGSGPNRVHGYSIDSRTIKAGELFFALNGPRSDGHDFIAQAAQRGAAGAVVSRVGQDLGTLPRIEVSSTMDALHELARAVRKLWGRPIIAVTGSVGKTTTKEMIAAILGKKFNIFRSVGNMNNEYGLPLCLLRVEKYQDLAVLEMGMSAAGEIAKLASIAEPNEGVITNVNPVHMEFFNSISGIAKAKAELLGGLVGQRRAYLNYDDPRVRSMARQFDGEIVTYGVRSPARFRVTRVENLGLEGSGFTVRYRNRNINLVLPLLGDHNISNAAAAISVALTHGLNWDDARLALEEMTPSKMRGAVIRFCKGFTVIDDSYNSNPKALTEMIRLLGSMAWPGRRILVAGEMLELGKMSAQLHAACGKEAMKAGFDLIVGVAGEAKALLNGAAEAGAEAKRLHFVRDVVEVGDFLTQTLKKDDLVLLKGSRGVRLEQALDTLRLNFRSLEP